MLWAVSFAFGGACLRSWSKDFTSAAPANSVVTPINPILWGVEVDAVTVRLPHAVGKASWSFVPLVAHCEYWK